MKNLTQISRSVYLWFDTQADVIQNNDSSNTDILIRILPFIIIHLMCLAVFFVGYSNIALLVCGVSYFLRMFAITGFYHRYYSHRSFKTSRVFRFIFTTIACSAAQRGPLWWCSHHRHHHRYSDQVEDHHSPHKHGLLHSHTGWFLGRENFAFEKKLVTDWIKYPEIRFLNRFDSIMPIMYMLLLYIIGEYVLKGKYNTSGMQILIWGFFVSTVLVYHITFCINSMAHLIGKRRYETKDQSRNNWLLALLALGEGWHNNHHFWSSSARQGFAWYEIDITYYVLKVFEFFGLVWDIREPPEGILDEKKLF